LYTLFGMMLVGLCSICTSRGLHLLWYKKLVVVLTIITRGNMQSIDRVPLESMAKMSEDVVGSLQGMQWIKQNALALTGFGAW